jgi:hypothetical protein
VVRACVVRARHAFEGGQGLRVRACALVVLTRRRCNGRGAGGASWCTCWLACGSPSSLRSCIHAALVELKCFSALDAHSGISLLRRPKAAALLEHSSFAPSGRMLHARDASQRQHILEQSEEHRLEHSVLSARPAWLRASEACSEGLTVRVWEEERRMCSSSSLFCSAMRVSRMPSFVSSFRFSSTTTVAVSPAFRTLKLMACGTLSDGGRSSSGCVGCCEPPVDCGERAPTGERMPLTAFILGR